MESMKWGDCEHRFNLASTNKNMYPNWEKLSHQPYYTWTFDDISKENVLFKLQTTIYGSSALGKTDVDGSRSCSLLFEGWRSSSMSEDSTVVKK